MGIITNLKYRIMANFRHTFEGRIFTIAETINLDGTIHLRVFNAKGQLVSLRLAESVRKSFLNK